MMSDLRKGDKLSVPGNPDKYFEVLDARLHRGTISVFDSEQRRDTRFEERKIRDQISSGRLLLDRKGMPRVSIAAQHDNPTLHAKVSLLHDALRRIGAIQDKRNLSFDAAIPMARQAYIAENADNPLADPFPSRATLYRAHRNQQLGLPVLRGDKNKGNTTPRYSKDLVEFVKGTIKDYHLVTESKWTVLNVTRYVNLEARRSGLHTVKHSISRKFVQSAIDELTVDAEYDRMNPHLRIAGKSFAKNRIRAPFPFARIEQDALHLPFVVRTPHGIARTVYAVLAIDVCTGYPAGWHLVIGAPREMDSLLCLETYLTPAKAARFKALGVNHELNVYGTPSQVVFDNGPETKGARIFRLESLGMDVKHCKAKEAQGKPFIERLNRALKEDLQRLPGCTRFDGKDGMRDPEKLRDPLMTIEELEKWMVGWLYNDWANRPLDRLRWDELLDKSIKGKTPLERLTYQTEEMGQPITMPPPRQQWMAALFEHDKRTLSAKTGITLHGLRYRGDAMSYLLAKYGDGAQVHVLYNPDDFRQVYVYEGDGLPLVTLPNQHLRPGAPAWTFAEAKSQFEAGMADWSVPAEKEQFQRDLDQAVTQTGRAGKSGGRGKRAENRETVRRAKEGRAVQRAFDPPVAHVPLGSELPPIPVDLEHDVRSTDVSYDEIPLMNIVNRKTGEKLL